MALALRRSAATRNLRIAIADRQAFHADKTACVSRPELFDARVSALTLSSQQLLARLGAWGKAQKMRVCPYRKMSVWDGEGNGSIHFTAAEIGQEQLGTIAENSVVQAALTEQLNHDETIQQLVPFCIESLEPDGGRQIRLTAADGQYCQTRLLIGADGANSRVRELMQFPTREWDYRQTALVTTVRTEQAHEHTARQRFMSSGPLAFLPLADGRDGDQHHCSIVWSCEPERAEQLMSLPDDAFCLELGRGFEHRLGEIEWCDRRFRLPLRQRHATGYFLQNAVLIGDAAHTIHPLAGQGVNLGLLDVQVLARELAAGITSGRPINDQRPLTRYQRKRRGHNLGMMWLMEGFKHLFAAQPPSLQWLRNTGLNAVDHMDLIKHQIVRRAIGLD